jgi:ABC-type amino acid transport substrate-binding protein
MKYSSLFFTIVLYLLSISCVYSQTLTVGIATNYPPIAFKEGNKIVGIEADLAAEVGKLTGMDIKLIDYPWDSLEKVLNDGKVDVVMSGVSVTPERQKRVVFTQPYMKVGQMVLIKASNIMTLASKMSMYSSGKTFGVEKNTTGQVFAKSEFSSSSIRSYDSVDAGISALKAGKIDYFIHDAPTIWQYTVFPKTQDKELFGLYEYMTVEPLAWAIKKGNTKLLNRLNKALVLMQEKKSVSRIVNHWIPVTVEVGN